ncbi:MAG: 1,4-alpha-glucan branching enzyme [Acidobacteria bacterium]|nr:MAG: 1,4-alpha-glucan branching enzyme [Acidobacteriota bacterium]
MATTAPQEDLARILAGTHHDPFHVLGAHPVEVRGGPAVAVRAFLPEAARADVRDLASGTLQPMERIHPDGFFEALFAGRSELFSYRLVLTGKDGGTREIVDPYSFWPILGDFDLHLFGEGTLLRSYSMLGAHPRAVGGIDGVLFAVWAPNAQRVSVVGDFNGWDGRRHPMRSRPGVGVWELFIPGLAAGERYKYEVRSKLDDYRVQKSDPYAFCAELRPRTASVVHDLDRYAWNDAEWPARRAERNGLDRPIAIYEVHLGSWKRRAEEGNRWLTYRELAEELVPYVRELGFTHIELLPITEHPLDASWGYQTTGYFAPTRRFGDPDDFMHFVDCCHQKGIGVILDWVPAHFPMDEHGLRFFDGTHLYEHADPRLGRHQDWGTAIFNFGRTEVRNFLLSNALFWLDRYHLDGLRVDAVASMVYLDYSRKPGEWIPNRYGGNENLEAIAFLKDLNTIVHREHPNVLTVAEESTAWPSVSRPVHLGGLGFSLKWNMGWMNDMLAYFSKDPVHRKYHHNNLTFALMYAFTENFVLVLSHDEVVHLKRSLLDKMPGDAWQKFANLRALYGLMFAFPGKKLLFMGGEIGQWREWDHDGSLDWELLDHPEHRRLQACVRELCRLYTDLPPLHEVDFHYTGFEWIDFADSESSVISFLRKSPATGDAVVVAGNFTPVPRPAYRVGVPQGGRYLEVFNSDSEAFGGSNLGNLGGVAAREIPCQNRPWSVELCLPPLAVLYLKRQEPS